MCITSMAIPSRVDISLDLRIISPTAGVTFIGSVCEVHLFLHGLNTTSGLVTNTKDSEVVVSIVLVLIL